MVRGVNRGAGQLEGGVGGGVVRVLSREWSG